MSESQILLAYSDRGSRPNWAFGITQTPAYLYLLNSGLAQTAGVPPGATVLYAEAVKRLVIRDAYTQASYPFDRFNRVEVGLHLSDIGQATFVQQEVDQNNQIYVNDGSTIQQPDIAYVSPTLAYVHDNSLFGFVGPFVGSRERLEIAPALGGWQFEYGLADLRHYFFLRPFTLALRTMVQGRVGPNADEFPIYLGDPAYLRGYTAGSILLHECSGQVPGFPIIGVLGQGNTGCAALDQLLGSRIAVANVELRFPLTPALTFGFLPPLPVEAAVFYDVGLAWQNGSQLKWTRAPTDSPENVRIPLRSWGGSLRFNVYGLFILRLDLAEALDRPYSTPYPTVSVGETF
jgi:outer membrane protein assembly factor BamA